MPPGWVERKHREGFVSCAFKHQVFEFSAAVFVCSFIHARVPEGAGRETRGVKAKRSQQGLKVSVANQTNREIKGYKAEPDQLYMPYVLINDAPTKYVREIEAGQLSVKYMWRPTDGPVKGLFEALRKFEVNNTNLKLYHIINMVVIWDPYLEKREDKHNFKEVASFTGLLCSPEHNKPYYPNRVQRQFNRRQPVPRAPTCVEQNGLRLCDKPCAYKPKYNWVDLFSEGKWRDSIILTRGKKVHDGIPVCTEGYFKWFNSVSFTKLCPDAVNLTEDDDYDDGRVEVPHSQNEGGGGPAKVVEDPTRSVLVEALATKTLECESNKKLVEDLRMQLANKVKENETLSSINDRLMEEVYVNQDERPLPLNLVPHSEENVVEAEMWKQKYEELNAKFEEAQRRLSERDRNTANNKITKEKRFKNILVDSTKYWWVGMTSDENFVKLKTKYQSPIPPVSTLWPAYEIRYSRCFSEAMCEELL
ncbi:hypothetical protein GIB67_004397 [Kingdonia uniflora]|uniref:Uncharacterized protein n=1 Tax=Kingdonia uniflora TaxID=39325 RepID=A0A7J7MRA4_9MAGN|nr:hypothetical protein GIB67_004397 [Kingdonia uniflora]